MSGLSPYALDILELLERDLEDSGPGVPAADIAAAATTRCPHAPIRQLRAAGYVIEETGGHFRLWEKPTSSESPTPATPLADGSGPTAPVGGSLDAGQLALNGERAA